MCWFWFFFLFADNGPDSKHRKNSAPVISGSVVPPPVMPASRTAAAGNRRPPVFPAPAEADNQLSSMSSSEGEAVNSRPGVTSYDDCYSGQYQYQRTRAPVGVSMSLDGSLDSLTPTSLLDQRMQSLEKQLDIELKV